MDPFDIPTDAVTISGSWNNYLDYIEKNYFQSCYQAQVLEIGPSVHAEHTKIIVKQNPKHLEVIDGDIQIEEHLKKINGIDSVIIDDVMLALSTPKLFDVVICFGVLYHLHSPLHLLELIVNNCKPTEIILDSVVAPHPLVFNTEIAGRTGNNQIRSGWKSSQLNFVVPFFIINRALKNMDYQLTNVNRLNIDGISKPNSWVASWKQQENQ